MSDTLNSLFRTDYMPHGHCYYWKPEILWLNVFSDLLIASAYFSIPIAIYYFVKRRPDIEFKGIFLLFSLFILCCGITHVISIVVIWHGSYGIHGLSKLVTAVVSMLTAYKVFQSIPLAVSLPSIDEMKKAYEDASNEKIARLKLENQQAQDALLRESTESAHVGILVVDSDGIIQLANSAVCKIFAYSKEELEGQSVDILIPAETKKHHMSLVSQYFNQSQTNRAMNSGRLVDGLTKQGRAVPVEIVLNYRHHMDKKLVFASVVDVSERLASQAALEKSENTTRSIVETLPLGLHFYELIGDRLILTGYNPAAEKILGIEHACLVGKTLEQAFPDVVGTETPEQYRRAALNGETIVNSVKYYDDGKLSGTFLIHCFQSNPNIAIAMFQDITEQKKAEQEVIAKEQFIRRAFDSSITGVYIHNRQSNKMDFINQSYTRITGLTLEDVNKLDRHQFLNLLHPDDRQKMASYLNSIYRARETRVHEIEYRIKHADGHWIWCLSQDTPFEWDSEGNVTSVIGSLLDITQSKKMQENLIELKNSAEKANSIKSEFLANMSHEIRTPMNAILGLTHIVLDMELGNKQREYLSKVENSSKSLLNILNDILDYAKIEAGKLDIVIEPFSLDQVVANVIDLFSLIADEKNVELLWQLPANIPHFYLGDQLRITQVLNNIVGNALKFTEAGSVRLYVDATQGKNADTYDVRFAVQDTGIGMSEQQMEQLFQSFSQADSSISRTYGGTGLGMSISKRLATSMGGEIKVESQLHEGSTFSLTLPLMIASETEQQQLREKQRVSKLLETGTLSSLSTLSNVRILLVEDNPTNRLVATQMLSSFGAVIEIAKNGEQALQMFADYEFDIVLMDLQMPVMDGYAATRRIRLTEKGKHVPIIAMSAAVMKSDIAMVEEAGMNGHIAKPIDVQKMVNEINAWLPKPAVKLQAKPRKALLSDIQQQQVDKLIALGLDANTAILRLGYNMDLYLGTLQHFCTDHAASAMKLKDLIDKQDFESAQRLMHTLKGLAGSIGAINLQKLARSAELELLEDSATSVSACIEELSSILVTLRGFLDSLPEKVSAKTEQDSDISFARLEYYLTRQQMIPQEMRLHFEHVLGKQLNESVARALFEAIDKLDYAEALRLIKAQSSD